MAKLEERVRISAYKTTSRAPTGCSAWSPRWWCSRDAVPLVGCIPVWQMVREAAGIPTSITWHNLRHTCGSLMVSSGVSLPEVKEYISHADLGGSPGNRTPNLLIKSQLLCQLS